MSFTESYIIVQGKYEPINAKACGVRCATCGLEYPTSQVDEHLKTHVNPKYAKSNKLGAGASSKAEKAHLFDIDEDTQTEIQVQSFLPD